MLRGREMVSQRSFHHALFAGFVLAVLIHAEDQSGFISIDCGIPDGSSYNDENTGINYISDANFIDSGISRTISSEFQTSALERQFYSVRSFPEGMRNCYTLNPAQGKNNRYLIRARFMYGNCDGQNSVPEFDLYLGTNLWETVELDNASSSLTTEIIYVAPSSYIFVCLVKRQGTPFISALELRLLNSSIYTTQSLTESLLLQRRYDFCSTTNQSVRYKDDIYDRIWMPKNYPDWEILSTSLPFDAQSLIARPYKPPSIVMRTACIPANNGTVLSFFWDYSDDPTSQYYIYIHLAEVELLGNKQTRAFKIFLEHSSYGPVTNYSLPETVFTTTPVTQGTGRVWLKLVETETSDLPPIINAIEIYMVKEFSQLQTDQNDVHAIMNIKSIYGVKRNWQGDPCSSRDYQWDGLNCSYENNYSPRIISVNISSSGLTGEIASYFADLTALESLDLSDNSLSGTVPEFLSQLSSLRTLNLKRNQLKGSLPAVLMERWKNGLLTLSVEGNPSMCMSASCKKEKDKFIVPVAGSAAALSVLLIALAIFCSLRTRKRQDLGKGVPRLENINDSFAPTTRQFTYSDVLQITNNFERVLGKGGFGTVYLGYLNDTEVAVKMLLLHLPKVKVLMRVHHRNLTTLLGYCMESSNLGLVYEYMAMGNLENYLSGKHEYILSWQDRLRIAVDAAQGLEYLHNGCKPPIVHRDVKPSNILLNGKLQAKIADFGLSRIFTTESRISISTEHFAGTPGYIDPECSIYNRLNEKSDVYSFGVVLLQILTTQPVIAKMTVGNVHISNFVKYKLAEGDIRKIIDPHLRDNFNLNYAWKAVELALACASNTSSERPTMSEVVMGLKECFAVEIARNDEGHNKLESVSLDNECSPLAR